MDLCKKLRKMADELSLLSQDAERLAHQKQKPSDKKTSLKSMQPMTRLYKNKDEIEDDKKNPEASFIINKLKDILGA